MRFENIEFVESGRFDRPGLGLFLRGHWVTKKTVVAAWKRASTNVPGLNWQVVQTTETIYNDQNWQLLPLAFRLALGRCIRFFVDKEMLPLEEVNPGKKGKRKYRRK